jgi:hypothetical protein
MEKPKNEAAWIVAYKVVTQKSALKPSFQFSTNDVLRRRR